MDLWKFMDILAPIKTLHGWVIKKLGYRLVKRDDYQNETVTIKNEYLDSSNHYKKLKEAGATFRWSKINHPGYEKYYEIDEKKNLRRYFKMQGGGGFLWVKFTNNKPQD